MSGVKKAFRKVKGKLHGKSSEDVSVHSPTAADSAADYTPRISPKQPNNVNSVKSGAAATGADVALLPTVVAPATTEGMAELKSRDVAKALAAADAEVPAVTLSAAPSTRGSIEMPGAEGKVVPPEDKVVPPEAQTVPLAAASTPASSSNTPITLTLKHLFYAWLSGMGLLLLAGLAWERPSIWEFLVGMVACVPLGILYAYKFKLNEVVKQESNNLLRVNPGIKGLNYLLGSVPTWISFKDKEKAEVLNAVVKEMWPYMDKAIVKAVKDAVEPMLDQFKPPLVAKIHFKEFTFGGAPMELDNVWVDSMTRDKLVLETDIRWCADTANIALACEMAGGGDFTRLVVKVSDIALSATARVTFQPLVNEYPGFGAMTVALMGPPILRYVPNFGKLGGSFTAKAVQLWLDGFIRQQLLGTMIWPQRIVVPMLDESITGPLDNLYLRNVGALRVDVIKARNLTKKDLMSESDAFVEAFTSPAFREKTKVINSNANPTWNETLWFLIQEPMTQMLYLSCFDHDTLSAKEALKLNFIRAGQLSSKELIGRCKVPLKDVCETPGEAKEGWYDLGREEFSNFSGCGMGEGQVRLKMAYFPLGMVNPETATKGALLVTVVRANNLPPEGADDMPDAYFSFNVKGSKNEQRTQVIQDSADPVFPDNKFEVMGVLRDDYVEVKLNESETYSRNDHLGTTLIHVKDLGVHLVEKTWPIELNRTAKKRQAKFATSQEPPTVTLKMQWIPFPD